MLLLCCVRGRVEHVRGTRLTVVRVRLYPTIPKTSREGFVTNGIEVRGRGNKHCEKEAKRGKGEIVFEPFEAFFWPTPNIIKSLRRQP